MKEATTKKQEVRSALTDFRGTLVNIDSMIGVLLLTLHRLDSQPTEYDDINSDELILSIASRTVKQAVEAVDKTLARIISDSELNIIQKEWAELYSAHSDLGHMVSFLKEFVIDKFNRVINNTDAIAAKLHRVADIPVVASMIYDLMDFEKVYELEDAISEIYDSKEEKITAAVEEGVVA